MKAKKMKITSLQQHNKIKPAIIKFLKMKKTFEFASFSRSVHALVTVSDVQEKIFFMMILKTKLLCLLIVEYKRSIAPSMDAG